MPDAYGNPLWCQLGAYWRFRETYNQAQRKALNKCNGRTKRPQRGLRGGDGKRGGNAGTPGKVNALFPACVVVVSRQTVLDI